MADQSDAIMVIYRFFGPNMFEMALMDRIFEFFFHAFYEA